jgi:lipopolysaccharide export system ATP-binding protein
LSESCPLCAFFQRRFSDCSGLVQPNSGNIYLDDLNITDYPMYKRAQQGIGYLAQEASVFRKLSIEDNILSVLQLTNLSKESSR